MTDASKNDDSTSLDELNEDGAGGTVGEKDTFEPEEAEAGES